MVLLSFTRLLTANQKGSVGQGHLSLWALALTSQDKEAPSSTSLPLPYTTGRSSLSTYFLINRLNRYCTIDTMTQPLTQKDKDALSELHRRKTKGMTPGLKNDIIVSLDDIIHPVVSHQKRFFPHNTGNVNEGTTCAGTLKYRGNIMTAIQDKKPVSEWDDQEILAYFCSCINDNFTFSPHHRETRTRLLAILAARLKDSDTPLMAVSTNLQQDTLRKHTDAPRPIPWHVWNMTPKAARFSAPLSTPGTLPSTSCCSCESSRPTLKSSLLSTDTAPRPYAKL
jgi:hypothetical protein